MSAVMKPPPQESDRDSERVAPALSELLEVLELEQSSDGTYSGLALGRNLPKTFGGLILAQAVCAADHATEPGRRMHSFHAYFLTAGDPLIPLQFLAQTTRQGGSFSTLEVTARQGGRLVLSMMASFHVAETGFEHEAKCLERSSVTDSSPIGAWAPEAGVRLPVWWTTDGPVEVRFESRPVGLVGGPPSAPDLRIWLRPADQRSLSPLQSQALLAFASDLSLLDVALQPLGRSWFSSAPVRGASLDHAMWLHRSFDWTDWVCFDVSSSISTEGRALVQGEVRTADGHLVATVVQEGLLRTS